MNQEMVRQALKTMKQGTKSMVAATTGLSIATCGNLLNELLDTGELLELGMEESSGGRPARLYRFNENFSYVACIIIRAGVKIHSLTYTIANLAGETISEGYQENNRIDSTVIDKLVDQLIDLFPQIRAVGIGVPGAVNQGIINTSDIQELINVPLAASIQENHEVEVIVENDMNLTVYGFYQKQGYDEEKSVAVATFIEGCLPGAGMMVGGHIHRGITCFAGEIAFLPFGMSHDELYRQLHDRTTFHYLSGHAVASLIAIMNPETIALTGSLVDSSDLDLIRQECLKYIPEMHIPKLTLLEHPDEDYMYGLITMTLESLSYSLKLVEKRR
ncbi:ROK family protein [Paenibacillus sp. JNUCC31]|uniref:ROK family protein n=1 Tax=Paenibacillus sp. JNUCC-31 TaxID=2777983 RepID=UPI001782D17D|nr:ROK family protein [Paenibacillus sp. JNUCC-31]QOS79433.1 ROK family protein [Paenibacillus sp. JNUCC-31]